MLPGAYERFYELLRDALITGGPPPVNPADSVATLRVIEAAQQSAQESKIVEL
jgi:predicted dehydrogenase